MEQKLVNSKQLSRLIPIPVWSIQKLVREKKIPAYKIGRTFLFDPDEVIACIKKHKTS